MRFNEKLYERWDFSLSIILRIFLIFSYFEPGYSYKRYSYKKTVYLVRYRNAFFCGRQYRCREILGYTRGEFVSSYCAIFSYGWRNISR